MVCMCFVLFFFFVLNAKILVCLNYTGSLERLLTMGLARKQLFVSVFEQFQI